MATLRAADVLSDVSVTSAGKKRLPRKTTGRKATSPCTWWGVALELGCGPGWGRGRGGEEAGPLRGGLRPHQKCSNPCCYDGSRLVAQTSPPGRGKQLPERSGSPNSHLVVPFRQIHPWDSSAQGQPQRSDPEPQGPRQALSETEKPAGPQLWGELGNAAASSLLPQRPPGLSLCLC